MPAFVPAPTNTSCQKTVIVVPIPMAWQEFLRRQCFHVHPIHLGPDHDPQSLINTLIQYFLHHLPQCCRFKNRCPSELCVCVQAPSSHSPDLPPRLGTKRKLHVTTSWEGLSCEFYAGTGSSLPQVRAERPCA
jgi:hypothetical protein